MPTFDDALRSLDDRFARLRDDARIPGVAWGVVRDGALVHAGGAGTIRDGEDRRPDAGSVFRIASMTKSFTAATVLLLRDEGLLRLDEPVATYVPELAAWRLPTADSAPVTVRQLLTMSAGLATDDPWGDRQQGLPLDAFAELLAAGPSFAWPPGTVFDYSNLGYGILGRAISNVAGHEYRDVVRDRVLAPLRMTTTVYREEDVPEARLAHGYIRREDAYVREGTDPYGALASMGGVFSCVEDLGRWVAGFADAFPARDDVEGRHPLRRATRREMQQIQRAFGPVAAAHAPDAEPGFEAGGYGFGLFVLQDAELGTTVGHAGGYPGFGSHMTWHPGTGLGVIGLGNVRYAPVRPVVAEVLAMLVRAEVAPRRRVVPMAAALSFRPVVEGLLERWDDGVADAAFAMNMDLDEPRDLRRAAARKIAQELGPFRPDPARPDRSDSPAALAWWLRGERGWVRPSILVTPEPDPRLQRLALLAVGDPSPALRGAAEQILALAAEPEPAWPDDLDAGDGLDREAVLRALRAGGARFGPLRLGLPADGDGRASSTFEIESDRGHLKLTVALDPGTGAVTAASLLVRAREAPPEAW
ncbi:MAG: serine hydrolase domain-containing protein [Candidatus Limnocylindrales bacterium]